MSNFESIPLVVTLPSNCWKMNGVGSVLGPEVGEVSRYEIVPMVADMPVNSCAPVVSEAGNAGLAIAAVSNWGSLLGTTNTYDNIDVYPASR